MKLNSPSLLEMQKEMARLRAENEILTRSNDHYADKQQWTQSDYVAPGWSDGNDLYTGDSDNGYDIARQAKEEVERLRAK